MYLSNKWWFAFPWSSFPCSLLKRNLIKQYPMLYYPYLSSGSSVQLQEGLKSQARAQLWGLLWNITALRCWEHETDLRQIAASVIHVTLQLFSSTTPHPAPPASCPPTLLLSSLSRAYSLMTHRSSLPDPSAKPKSNIKLKWWEQRLYALSQRVCLVIMF